MLAIASYWKENFVEQICQVSTHITLWSGRGWGWSENSVTSHVDMKIPSEMEVAEWHKAFYGFHGYMDIWLLGNVVLWLNGNMAALHKVVQCTSKSVYFVCFVNSFLYLRIYLSQYIRRCLIHIIQRHHLSFCSKCALAPSKPRWTGEFAFSFFLLEPSLLSLLAIFQLRCWSVFLWNAKVPSVKKNCFRKYPLLLINQ